MISVIDLIYINDAAKALKQKQFLFYKNCLFGLDFINLDNSLVLNIIPLSS